MRAPVLLLSLLLIAPGRQQGQTDSTITLRGELTFADYERLFEREFDVPAGTRRIQVDYEVTGADRRTVVDLGLRGPSGFRGWSGGGKSSVFVSALGATYGYLSGPIEPGRWAVLLGVPNIRRDSVDRYVLTIRCFETDLAPPTYVARMESGWYAGDLHAHSGHSDGRSMNRDGRSVPAPVHHVLDAAASAGLDFIALTDHNTVSHWLDVDRLQPSYGRLLLLHGREVTTYRGHANTVGESSFVDFRLPSPAASPAALLRQLHAPAVFVSINHPSRPDDESCMGCGWNVIDGAVMQSVDGIEVVNGATRTGAQSGWPFWAARLNEGFRLTAVGGSDDHNVDADDGTRIGTPATVIYARELSEAAIIDGLKRGRVYLRTRGVSGPAIDFWAEQSGHRVEMGGTVSSAMPVTLHLTQTGATGQAVVEWVRNGAVTATEPLDVAARQRTLDARDGDWFSVVVRDRHGEPTVIANAIYVRE